jgi:hypothetical protein
MAGSRYFNNYNSSSEQNLIESLVHEALQMYSADLMYIKRQQLNQDTVITDDKLSKFSAAFPVGCYIKTVDGFTGDGQFLSKFGVEIRDQVVLTLSRREFQFEVINVDTSFTRPREGDLIYFPMTGKLFEITFVDYKPVMYQFGSLQSYDLTCEVFAFNNEEFDTGYDYIDQIFAKYVNPGNSVSKEQLLAEDGSELVAEDGTPLTWGNGDPQTNDPGSENTDIGWEGEGYIDYTDQNPLTNGKF